MSDLEWLQALIAREGAAAGSVHRRVGDQLEATAFVGIPPPVRAVTATIPCGKGMAGLAWQRRAPVSTCNLATDPTDDIRPGARTVAAQAAVALPVFDAAGEVRAVVGLAFASDAPLDDTVLQAAAAGLPPG